MAKEPKMVEGVLARDTKATEKDLKRCITFWPGAKLCHVTMRRGAFGRGAHFPPGLPAFRFWTPKEWSDTHKLRPPAPGTKYLAELEL